eukprot:TRINITY_DN4363_c0_g1_i2.p1 TRINITY_DN4363_c0_g1~~TRINITY_DN4363_c0_g1_i2.p1  ORF type:complete len:175 (-),score=27.50 TRINITY_DN4363_c0_g1_i2:223-747(-)
MAAKQGGKRGLIYLSNLKNLLAVSKEEAVAPLRTGFLIEKHHYDKSGVPKAPEAIDNAYDAPVDKIEDARYADTGTRLPSNVEWSSWAQRMETLKAIPQLPDDFDFSVYDTIKFEDIPHPPGIHRRRFYKSPPRSGWSDDANFAPNKPVTAEELRQNSRFPQPRSIHANKKIEG